MSRAMRWLSAALAVLTAVMAVGAAFDHRWPAAAAWALAAGYWSWQLRRVMTAPAPPPAHVDEDWARGVLASAGGPQGVQAVKALREAEPRLTLLSAKQLADRVAGR